MTQRLIVLSTQGIIVGKGTVIILFPALVASAVCLVCMNSDQRYVAAPALATFNIALGVWVALWQRDRVLPLFDVGAVCIAATLAYTIFPLLGFLLSANAVRGTEKLRTFRPAPRE